MTYKEKGFRFNGFELGQKVIHKEWKKGKIIAIYTTDMNSEEYLFVAYKNEMENGCAPVDSNFYKSQAFIGLKAYKNKPGAWTDPTDLIPKNKTHKTKINISCCDECRYLIYPDEEYTEEYSCDVCPVNITDKNIIPEGCIYKNKKVILNFKEAK